jgi:phosphoglycerate dehydrogenase-like enzyme
MTDQEKSKRIEHVKALSLKFASQFEGETHLNCLLAMLILIDHIFDDAAKAHGINIFDARESTHKMMEAVMAAMEREHDKAKLARDKRN